MQGHVDWQYNRVLDNLLRKAKRKPLPITDRTGVGTYKTFHETMRIDLQAGFPILTTKFVSLRSVVGELLWLISGNTNAHELEQKYNCTIWREWAKENGDLGRVYGAQWRDFGGHDVYDGAGQWVKYENGVDQIRWLINEIKTNPMSRRLYVTAIAPQDRGNQQLDTCHNYFQVFIEDGRLNLYFQMRSTDVFLGLPYNIASYAVLAHMLALECGYEVGELVYSGVDVHLYSNHIEQAQLQVERIPYQLPELVINKKPFFEYTQDDFKLENYQHHPSIKADVAV